WPARHQAKLAGIRLDADRGARPGKEALRRRQERTGSAGGQPACRSRQEMGRRPGPLDRPELHQERVQLVPQSQLSGPVMRSPAAEVSALAIAAELGSAGEAYAGAW